MALSDCLPLGIVYATMGAPCSQFRLEKRPSYEWRSARVVYEHAQWSMQEHVDSMGDSMYGSGD